MASATETPTRDADAALVAAARHDPTAFAPLYDRYFDAVYRYCYHRLGSWPEAEDATATIFARALAALPRYRDGSFRSWLFAIAHNVVANAHRARRDLCPLDAAAAIPAPSPEEAALSADAARTLRGLLNGLTDDQRRVVELRLAGLTDAEIAHVLGRSPGAVRATQYRAIARLRTLLVPETTPRKEEPDD